MTLVALLYGANYSAIKIVTPDYILPNGYLVIRVVVSALLFWLISIKIREKIDWKKDGFRLFLSAFLGAGINMIMFYEGMSRTTAINGSIIMTLTPLLVFLLSLFILKETLKPLKLVGLFIGLIGAVFIIYISSRSNYQGNWVGDMMIFVNALTYGGYLVAVKPLLSRYRPLTIAKWIFLFGALMIGPYGFTELMAVDWSLLHTKVYLSMAYSIIGVTVVVYILNIWAMKKVSPSTVGAYIYLQPVFATFVASMFFDEQLTLMHLLSAFLVFLGVGLVIKPVKG